MKTNTERHQTQTKMLTREQIAKIAVAKRMLNDTSSSAQYWKRMGRKLRRECAKVMSEIRSQWNDETTITRKTELYIMLSDQLRMASSNELEARRLVMILSNLIKNTKAGL